MEIPDFTEELSNITIIKNEPPDSKDDYDHFDLDIDTVPYLNVTLENFNEDVLYDPRLESNFNGEYKNLSFKCEICKRGFKSFRSLEVHSTIHKKNDFRNMSTCTICHKKFETRKLTYHFRTHNVVKSFQCYYCNLSYFNQAQLDDHILEFHTGHTCSKCNISFEKETDLKEHYKTHVDKCLYACSICDQTFASTTDLSRHVSTHIKKRKILNFVT